MFKLLLCRLLCWWLITLSVSGCVYYRGASNLQIDESSGWKSKDWVYGGVQQNWIYNDSISIMVKPHNYGNYSATTILPVPFIPVRTEKNVSSEIFAISVVFDSGVNTWHGVPKSLRFDPFQVELQTEDGNSSLPIGYVRPEFNNFHCYDFEYDKQFFQNLEIHKLPSGWLEFPEERKGRCFYLIYSKPPHPLLKRTLSKLMP